MFGMGRESQEREWSCENNSTHHFLPKRDRVAHVKPPHALFTVHLVHCLHQRGGGRRGRDCFVMVNKVGEGDDVKWIFKEES